MNCAQPLTSRLPTTVVAILLCLVAVQADAQPDVTIDYVGEFGNTARNVGPFRCPLALAFGSEGNILVGDECAAQIFRCDPAGNCTSIPYPAILEGVSGIAMDASGRVLFNNFKSNRLMRCASDTECEAVIDATGTGPGEFMELRDFALDSQGRIVAVDRGTNRFQICESDGTGCTIHGMPNPSPFPPPGEFGSIRSVSTDGNGLILIGDTGDEIVHLCNESGTCTERFGGLGDAPGQLYTPIGLGVTSRGDIVVVELSNRRISVCNRAFECAIFGSSGGGPLQFQSPSELLIDENDRMWVSEQDGQRVQILQLRYLSDPPAPEFQINAGLNDAWYNPLTPGQGFFFNVFPDFGLIFAAWFTYDTQRPTEDAMAQLGEPGHRWLTAIGPFEGTSATLDVELTEGGVFNSEEDEVQQSPGYGTIMLEFEDCASATLSYDIPSAGPPGVIAIERIVDDNIVLCEALGSPAE